MLCCASMCCVMLCCARPVPTEPKADPLGRNLNGTPQAELPPGFVDSEAEAAKARQGKLEAWLWGLGLPHVLTDKDYAASHCSKSPVQLLVVVCHSCPSRFPSAFLSRPWPTLFCVALLCDPPAGQARLPRRSRRRGPSARRTTSRRGGMPAAPTAATQTHTLLLTACRGGTVLLLVGVVMQEERAAQQVVGASSQVSAHSAVAVGLGLVFY